MASEKPKRYQPRVSPWILGVFVLGLLTMLVVLQSSTLWKRFTIETANDTLALYALSSLNFIAFVIFAFIFFRSLIKLRRERRASTLGSQIKSRLLIYFFAVSILPIVAMAIFSSFFLNRAVEGWLEKIPASVVHETQVMQNQAITDQNVRLNEMARMLVSLLEGQPIDNEKLSQLVKKGNLTKLEILSAENQVIAESGKELDQDQQVELATILAMIHGDDSGNPILSDGTRFDAAMAPFTDGRRLIIVPDLIPDSNVNQTVSNSLIQLGKLKEQQANARQMGFSTLGLLTFLLIFASSWTALHIARGLTIPIKALAEGSDEIARGNLSYRVDTVAEDELALLVTAFNEMSARLEANSGELLERRKYIETILLSLSTGVISFDAENRVTTINRAAVQMLRLEGINFDDFALSALGNNENRLTLEKLLSRARRSGQATEQTILMREDADGSGNGNGGGNDTGENIPVALTATALPKTSEEKSSGVVLVIEDLTELLQAQRASAWAEVARRMAHEIKNPLTPIQLSAERIAKRFAQSGQLSLIGGQSEIQNPVSKLRTVVDESTETILREVNSLKLMVDEFSRFARLPNVQLESGSLNEIIEQAVDSYQDRLDKVAFKIDLGEGLPEVLIDAEQLRRVFINLIENAVESFSALQIEKQISVKTFYDRARDLLVAEVSDNGNGIPPADFQKLFQPYFSTKGRGTGLGLAIVQRIVIEHGGKIKAVNNSPKGAKFIVELPLIN